MRRLTSGRIITAAVVAAVVVVVAVGVAGGWFGTTGDSPGGDSTGAGRPPGGQPTKTKKQHPEEVVAAFTAAINSHRTFIDRFVPRDVTWESFLESVGDDGSNYALICGVADDLGAMDEDPDSYFRERRARGELRPASNLLSSLRKLPTEALVRLSQPMMYGQTLELLSEKLAPLVALDGVEYIVTARKPVERERSNVDPDSVFAVFESLTDLPRWHGLVDYLFIQVVLCLDFGKTSEATEWLERTVRLVMSLRPMTYVDASILGTCRYRVCQFLLSLDREDKLSGELKSHLCRIVKSRPMDLSLTPRFEAMAYQIDVYNASVDLNELLDEFVEADPTCRTLEDFSRNLQVFWSGTRGLDPSTAVGKLFHLPRYPMSDREVRELCAPADVLSTWPIYVSRAARETAVLRLLFGEQFLPDTPNSEPDGKSLPLNSLWEVASHGYGLQTREGRFTISPKPNVLDDFVVYRWRAVVSSNDCLFMSGSEIETTMLGFKSSATLVIPFGMMGIADNAVADANAHLGDLDVEFNDGWTSLRTGKYFTKLEFGLDAERFKWTDFVAATVTQGPDAPQLLAAIVRAAGKTAGR